MRGGGGGSRAAADEDATLAADVAPAVAPEPCAAASPAFCGGDVSAPAALVPLTGGVCEAVGECSSSGGGGCAGGAIVIAGGASSAGGDEGCRKGWLSASAAEMRTDGSNCSILRSKSSAAGEAHLW